MISRIVFSRVKSLEYVLFLFFFSFLFSPLRFVSDGISVPSYESAFYNTLNAGAYGVNIETNVGFLIPQRDKKKKKKRKEKRKRAVSIVGKIYSLPMGSVFAHKDNSLNRKTPPPPPHSQDLHSNFGLTKRRFSAVSRRNTSHRRFTIRNPSKSSIVFQRRNYTPLPSTTHAGILLVQFSLCFFFFSFLSFSFL